MILLVQEYLMEHTQAELSAEHGVRIHMSTTRPYKANFNYDQLEARDDDPLSQQCRGLILRTQDGTPFAKETVIGPTVVMARPFDRFFNLGQGAAADIDLSSAKTVVLEKLDGSLLIAYFDDLDESWQVGTRKVCEADAPINGWEDGGTFRTLFEEALSKQEGMSFLGLTCHLDKKYTYMFELCTPMNQIVVRHNEFSLTLLGCRETATGQERWPWEVAGSIGVPSVKRHYFKSHKDMMEVIADRNPLEYEGVVLCDPHFRRLKIKSSQYVALSRLSDAVASSPRNVMMLIVGESMDDAIPVMSDHVKEKAMELQEGYRLLCKQYPVQYAASLAIADATGEEHGSREHRKEFAIQARKTVHMFSAAMQEYVGHSSGVQGYVSNKRDKSPNSSLPGAFLDVLIKSSLEMIKEQA